MLAEANTPSRNFVGATTSIPRLSSFSEYAAEFVSFAAVVVQFGLIVLVINYWQLESLSLARMMSLALAGFIIHHLLPFRFRLPFFALLSIVGVTFGLAQVGARMTVSALMGKTSLVNFLYPFLPGTTLIVVGLLLIAFCHLPIRFWTRVALIGIVATGLIVLRANTQWFPDVKGMWALLGSMFMFRLMIYLYDLKHRTVAFSPARAMAYFFMLPNVCYPLYPIVDYKTFWTTYYNEDWRRVYQSGIRWMLRGVIQLLLYRVVYQYAPLDVSKLSTTLDAAGFMVGMYLVYLRVSGSFHLIVGLLHMFGFNLPETHHLYFLATSFTDLWRRINIYWKDFVMKLFFYPVHFKLRTLGTLRAMTIATMVTFVATWLLHSWQWFWILGRPLFTWKDFSFWMILAALVLVNVRMEITAGRQRALTPSRVRFRHRLRLGIQAAGVFSAMCVLWTFWTCQSWAEFQTLFDAFSKPSLRDVAIIAAGLGAICVGSMVWGQSSRETSEGRKGQQSNRPFAFWPSVAWATAGAACLLAIPSVATRMNPSVHYIIARLHSDVLNARDIATQRRGYYEELDVNHMDNWQWQRKEGMPEHWADGKKVFYRDRHDFLLTEIVPSASTVLGGSPIKSNSIGMRDREYSLAKPPNTLRIVLVGGSHDMGAGVRDNETYENLVEDRLNTNAPSSRYSHYEILNLSVGASGVVQRVLWLEERGLQFEPDVAMLSVAAYDQQFLIEQIRKVLAFGIQPPPAYREIFDRIVRESRVRNGMPDAMIERRLQPYVNELYEWSFQRFAKVCRDRGIRPLVIFRPAPVDLEHAEPATHADMLRLAQAAGLEVIDLSHAFDTVTNRDSLIVAKWEQHTTASGHRLLADKLYDGLVATLFKTSDQTLTERGATPQTH